MIVGLILGGSTIGAIAAQASGQTSWKALQVYSGVGVLSVLAGAAMARAR